MAAAPVFRIVSSALEALSVPALVGILAVATACGGGGSGSTPPTAPGPTGSGNDTATLGATITIGSNVSPKDVRIEVGQTVRFVNNDGRAHALRSDPHPSHGSCPPIDGSGTLSPGANVVVGPFNSATACRYHDHNDPANASFQGNIRVGVDSGTDGPGYIRP